MHCNVGHNTPVWLQQRWQGHLQLSLVDTNNGFHPKNPSDGLDDVAHWLSVQCYAILRLHYSCPVISLQLGYFAQCTNVWVTTHSRDRCFGNKGRMYGRNALNVWVTHCSLLKDTWTDHCGKAWQQRRHICTGGRHFIGGYLGSFPRYSELFAERCTFFISFTCLSPQLEVTPLEFHKDLWHQKTRVSR